MNIQRVLLVGGTHGNELIGIYLIKKFEQYPELIYRSSFETLTLLSNPRAIEKCVRYVDKDLNRCFDFKSLENKRHNSEYEMQLAQRICNEFGPFGRTPVDLFIDQHSTTSNAGLMLILDQIDPFILNLSAYLSSLLPEIKVYSAKNSGRRQDSLRSIARYRIGIEVGPLSHGTLHSELLQKTESLVHLILNYVEQYNRNIIRPVNQSLTLYEYSESIDYPRNKKGEIKAMIHPQLQFQDYEALHPGTPLFMTFDGKTIIYQGKSTAYPIFINESAYYEKGIAMCLTQKKQFQIDKS